MSAAPGSDSPGSGLGLSQAITLAVAQGLDRLEAQQLLLHTLGRAPHDRAWLLVHDTDTLSAPQYAAYNAAVHRRTGGEPLGYITGQQAFYGLELAVDARVLVPRPDTETLVDWALAALADTPQASILDLGTGSGAIALALKHTRPDWQVHAVDASTEALAVAQTNAQRLGLAVAFSQGSWLTQVQGRFHAIVSNPPYIAAQDPHLAALTHEPLAALASGAQGLDDLRSIVLQAPVHLHSGGWLLLEHGYDQAAAVRTLLTEAGLAQVQSRRDLAGIERCSGGQCP